LRGGICTSFVRDKDLPIGIDALEAHLYFRGFYGEENITLKAQLGIAQFDKIYLPVQQRQLLHPYSEGQYLSPSQRARGHILST
jgi:hypothetical protein